MNIHVYHLFELGSFLVALWTYPFLKNSCLKWFPVFLFFIIVGEVIAYCQNHFWNTHTFDTNYVIGMVEVCFYGYIFYRLSEQHHYRKWIAYMIAIGFFVFAYCCLMYRNQFIYFFYSLIISGFLIAAMALLFLLKRLEEDRQDQLLMDPGFWLAFGVVLFFSGVSIVFSMYEVVKKHNLTFFGEKLYHIIPRLLSIVLYSCISISLLICRKKKSISY